MLIKELRIVAQRPFHPWWDIASQIALHLDGYVNPALPGYSIGVYTPPHGVGALRNPVLVARGDFELGITTPTLTAKLAYEGLGPFREKMGNLRGIALYPHQDYIIFAVSPKTGLKSLREIAEKHYPLKVVTGRRGPEGPDMLTFVVEEVLKAYGFSFREVERWGGKVFFGGGTRVSEELMRQCASLVMSGEVDAIFQEGQSSTSWDELIDKVGLRVLQVDEPVIDLLHNRYGVEGVRIPRDRFEHLDSEIRTVDFSGWLLFTNSELPDEVGYQVAKACVETRGRVQERWAGDDFKHRHLASPIKPEDLCRKTGVPLHPGAEAYYGEAGFL